MGSSISNLLMSLTDNEYRIPAKQPISEAPKALTNPQLPVLEIKPANIELKSGTGSKIIIRPLLVLDSKF